MKILFSTTALFLFVAFLCTPFLASAAVQTPIDGGSSILVIAGVSYVSKKIAAKRKKNSEIKEQSK